MVISKSPTLIIIRRTLILLFDICSIDVVYVDYLCMFIVTYLYMYTYLMHGIDYNHRIMCTKHRISYRYPPMVVIYFTGYRENWLKSE